MKRIAPLQAGKMLAALYGLLSLVIVPIMLAAMGVSALVARGNGGAGAPAIPLMLGMGVGFVIFIPVLYAFIGFLAGVIGAFVYNLLAKWMGGFELEFESTTPPPTV